MFLWIWWIYDFFVCYHILFMCELKIWLIENVVFPQVILSPPSADFNFIGRLIKPVTVVCKSFQHWRYHKGWVHTSAILLQIPMWPFTYGHLKLCCNILQMPGYESLKLEQSWSWASICCVVAACFTLLPRACARAHALDLHTHK